MSNLPIRSTRFTGGGGQSSGELRPRDARAVDRQQRDVAVRTASGIARIAGISEQYDEVLDEDTRLTKHAMHDTIEVSRLERVGAELEPGAAARLEFLADEHTMSEAAILRDARTAMRRTIG